MPIKKRDILRLLFKSRKGLLQGKKYNKLAKEFWKQKEEEMIKEINKTIKSSSDEDLLKISKKFSQTIGFPELACNEEEIYAFRMLLKTFGQDTVVKDFVEYGTRTGFLTMVIAPALAATDGIGDINPRIRDEWLYGIGLCLPVSADIIDSIMDKEVLRHPLIPYKNWILCQRIGASILYSLAFKHIKRIKTGDETLDQLIRKRVKEGIERVAKKQKIELELKDSTYIPLTLLEEIYEGKICEIEATVFGTIPSKKKDLVEIFEKGASFYAGEMQVIDDIEDLLGDPNLGKSPEIPNPSFFLTYCIELWKSGEKNIKRIMKEAMKKTLRKGEEYHKKVMRVYEKLPKKFMTRPFFDVVLWYSNKVLKNDAKKFLKERTFSFIEPKLSRILKKI